MKIALLRGHFSPQETIDMLSQILHVKIAFHENKIMYSDQEEDIKMREKRIHELQNVLSELKVFVKNNDCPFELNAEVSITPK
jgi:tRNA U34 5-carboxymethylaminomethyl modifying GTPase MnmE/TrmE